MYEKFFGLSEKPFSIQPDPSFLYWGRTHRLAYAMLEYGVLNHAGISVITGEVGCGKTTLIHRLLDQLSDTHTVALLSNIQEGRGDLLSWVLMGFGESFAGKSHVELFAQLQNYFISEYANGRRVVLVIDEAQNLSIDMLEELRMLSNINAGKDQLLQLILVGQPQLKGLLNKPELLQLAQRIGADFHLTPLNREEVHAYIETRLSIAGCRRRIFTERAMDFIAEQSKGVPRVINIIADTALVYAFSAEELVVGVETIRNVVRDKTEFGVFGLASDEKAAPPIKEESAAGLDSFADAADKKDTITDSSVSIAREDALITPVPPAREIPSSIPKTPGADEAAAAQTVTETFPEPVPEPPRDEVALTDTPAQAKEESSVTGVVVINVNEHASPEAAIRSAGDGRAIVFVSNASNEEARTIARKAGAVIAETAERPAETKGRLRNTGYRQLKKIAPHIKFVQFINSDQALAPDWISAAERFMARRPEVSLVEGVTAAQGTGKKNESNEFTVRQPGVEDELVVVDGGAALIRASSFEEAGGFRGDIMSAAMPDLSVRLRRRGGRLWRLASVMAITSKSGRQRQSWWGSKIAQGYKNAFCMSLHGGAPERLGFADTISAILLGAILPFFILMSVAAMAFLGPILYPVTDPILPVLFVAGAGLFMYLLAFAISGLSTSVNGRLGFLGGAKSVIGRIPELIGAVQFWLGIKKSV